MYQPIMVIAAWQAAAIFRLQLLPNYYIIQLCNNIENCMRWVNPRLKATIKGIHLFCLWKKGLWWRVTNMGSKISIQIYQWFLLKYKNWYMNGTVFKNVLKFEPTYENYQVRRNRWVTLKFGPNSIWFPGKISTCIDLFSYSQQHNNGHIPT